MENPFPNYVDPFAPVAPEQLRQRLEYLAQLQGNPMWKLFLEMVKDQLKTREAALDQSPSSWEAAQNLGAARVLRGLGGWVERESSTTKQALEQALELQSKRKP